MQGTLKSLLQYHNSKASILQSSAFFIVQLSHPYMTTGKTIALTRQILVGRGFPGGTRGKEPPANAGDIRDTNLIPGSGRSPGGGHGNPPQYSCLENPMDRGAWWAAVHGVAKSRTQLSDFTFTFHFHALEKEMAAHSSVLAWRIPGTGEPGGLPSMGSHRVGHD